MELSYAAKTAIQRCLGEVNLNPHTVVPEFLAGVEQFMAGYMTVEQFTVWWVANDWLPASVALCLRSFASVGV